MPREDHFETVGGRIVARSAIGRVTVTLLRVNLPARTEVRDELFAQGRWPAATSVDAGSDTM